LKQKAKSQKIERIKRKNKKNSPLQIEDWRFLNTTVKGASNQSKVVISLSLEVVSSTTCLSR
jgi:regulator of protease activity HflC (stomatin/prohibitin superfamily)